MNFNVGDLRAALAQLDANLEVLVTVNRAFVPVVGVTAPNGTSLVILQGKRKTQQPERFTIDEDGLIGHLSRLGMHDDGIGEVLGRPPKTVAKRRKTLGFDPGTKKL